MKGLLLKDYYMTVRYCRSMLLILLVFVGVSFVNPDNRFFTIYPCLLCSMIPITLISYDERSRWSQYSCTMPYTRAQLVGSKYLIGLLIDLTAVCFSLLAEVLRAAVSGGTMPSAGELLSLGEIMMAVSLAAPSLCLPWIIKLGVEKGRLVFYAVLVVIFGGSAAAVNIAPQGLLFSAGSVHLALVAMVMLFAASWALSVAIMNKKEV